MKKINVLIVDDSPTARDVLKQIIEVDAALNIAGMVSNGKEALKWLEKNTADVITMDILMPEMDGFETTKQILAKYPIPILIVSGVSDINEVKYSFKAMDAGALCILPKPMGPSSNQYADSANNLKKMIKIFAEVKLITRKTTTQTVPSQVAVSRRANIKAIDAIAFGTSLGGPQAIKQIFKQLPADFPLPIFVVQHISPGFVHGLVDWLNVDSPLKVNLAQNNQTAKPGNIYIAPDFYHMEVKKGGIISLVNTPPEDGLKPSVGHLFQSMATAYGSNAIGVILTGMGHDGALGLRAMKEAGAFTIAQSEESCIVFGMPKQAIHLQAVSEVIPLKDIATTILSLVPSGKLAPK